MGQMADREPVCGVASWEKVQQALALVRTLMDQLAADMAAEPEGQKGRLLQALALPQRAAAIRDLSFALRELISLERQQLGLDGARTDQLLEALRALAARICRTATEEAQADGQ